MSLTRRGWLAGAAALPLAGCGRTAPELPPLRWVGAGHERGHRLRELPAAAEFVPRRTGVLIVGAGVAGLAAARALDRAGIADLQLLELEDSAGGNSRGHRMKGLACPLGAHYLPLPGPHAHEVAALLEEFGLRRSVAGRVVYDERHLCHSPQERLFIDGAWHEGLLPPVEALPAAQRQPALAQVRRFAVLVAEAGRGDAFRIPSARAPWTPAMAALDAEPFATWLDRQGLDAPALRWLLDYACRDDYGADASQVSAWAGLHYFASRHGFHAPGESDDADAVLTWPEGNAWLATRMAAPLAGRIATGRVALQVDETKHGVTVDALDLASGRGERWSADAVVLAVPLFVAARLWPRGPDALRAAASAMAWSPWLVANLHLDGRPFDRPGVPPAWDNVAYGAGDLGYVDATHQRTTPWAGATVFTAYHALGGADDPSLRTARHELLAQPAAVWAKRVLDGLAAMHPDLRPLVTQIDLMRYGHAMAIPRPGVRGSAALRALASRAGRVQCAHADLAGLSVFEEALFHGTQAAERVAQALRGRFG